MSQGVESLCELYRRSVRECVRDYSPADGVDPDEDFKSYLQTTFAKYTGELASLQGVGESENAATAVSNGLFVLAAGLFAYGDLDKAEDVLTNVPTSGGIRRLALALPALLPLPRDLDVLQDIEPVREWLRQNRSRLRWSASAGAYLSGDASLADDST